MNNENSSGKRQKLRAFSRVVVSLGLQFSTFLIGLFLPEFDYGTYTRAKFWYALNNFVSEFSLVLLPTIAIFVLIPIFFRGSRPEKIIALFVSLLPTWLAFIGWQDVVCRFMESPFWK